VTMGLGVGRVVELAEQERSPFVGDLPDPFDGAGHARSARSRPVRGGVPLTRRCGGLPATAVRAGIGAGTTPAYIHRLLGSVRDIATRPVASA
jgi:hypothetical protein